MRANPDRIISPNDWRLFLFYGRSVRNLSALLSIELGIRRPSDAILCVRAGFFGRLTPLVTNLPHNNMLLNLDIVVITAGTSGEISFYSDRFTYLHVHSFCLESLVHIALRYISRNAVACFMTNSVLIPF